MVIKDSGERRKFDTGAVRDTAGSKMRPSLFHVLAWAVGIMHATEGCTKYGDRNYEKGIPVSVYADSLLRHMIKILLNLNDENHWSAVFWNSMGALYTLYAIKFGLLPPHLDDMPKYPWPDPQVLLDWLDGKIEVKNLDPPLVSYEDHRAACEEFFGFPAKEEMPTREEIEAILEDPDDLTYKSTESFLKFLAAQPDDCAVQVKSPLAAFEDTSPPSTPESS